MSGLPVVSVEHIHLPQIGGDLLPTIFSAQSTTVLRPLSSESGSGCWPGRHV
jgi:hypothetical protein